MMIQAISLPTLSAVVAKCAGHSSSPPIESTVWLLALLLSNMLNWKFSLKVKIFQVFCSTSKSQCLINDRSASVGVGNLILKIRKLPANLHLLRLPATGVPNGAARQNTRSTGQNSAGWEFMLQRWLQLEKKCLACRVCFSPGNRTIKNISFFQEQSLIFQAEQVERARKTCNYV